MRRMPLFLSLLVAAVAVPLTAHATSTDILTITGNGEVYTFTLPGGTVTPDGVDGVDDFFLNDIAETQTGTVAGSGLDTLYFFDASLAGGVSDTAGTSPGADALNLGSSDDPILLFSGDVASPTFLLGSGTLQTFDSNDPQYTYSLTQVGATPEPSSLILLGTGALGLLGSFRRRLFA